MCLKRNRYFYARSPSCDCRTLAPIPFSTPSHMAKACGRPSLADQRRLYEIDIQVADGTTATLEVSNVCKGAGLKELIATRFGTPPERQQLILHGRAIMHLLSQTRQRVPGRCPAT